MLRPRPYFYIFLGPTSWLQRLNKVPRFVAFANNENVRELCGKAVALLIFHMNYIRRAWMSLLVITPILPRLAPSSHHAQVTSVKSDEISNLANLHVNLNGVIHLDEGIGVTDGTSILGYQMRDSFCPHKYLFLRNLYLASSGVI